MNGVSMNKIAFMQIVEFLKAHAAFESLSHFFGVVFEAFKRLQLAFIDGVAVTLDSDDRATQDLSGSHITAGNHQILAEFEDLANFGCAGLYFLTQRLNQTLNGLFQIIGNLIDDAVGANVHVFRFSNLLGLYVGPNIKT